MGPALTDLWCGLGLGEVESGNDEVGLGAVLTEWGFCPGLTLGHLKGCVLLDDTVGVTAVLPALEEWTRTAIAELTVVADWYLPLSYGYLDWHSLEPDPNADLSTSAVGTCSARIRSTGSTPAATAWIAAGSASPAGSCVLSTATPAAIRLRLIAVPVCTVSTDPCVDCSSCSTAGDYIRTMRAASPSGFFGVGCVDSAAATTCARRVDAAPARISGGIVPVSSPRRAAILSTSGGSRNSGSTGALSTNCCKGTGTRESARLAYSVSYYSGASCSASCSSSTVRCIA